MKANNSHVVTGAFGYSGKYIAQQLLNTGHDVGTLTNSLNKVNPFGDKIEVHPLCFDDSVRLKEVLRNVDVLYNTYWVRFNHRRFNHSIAVQNTLKLFNAAKEAGVKRIVHISITNPSKDSHLEYFSGKGILEEALIQSGISYTILRPAVIFGKEDILINNITWMIRRFPVFAIFGRGDYRLQPIFVEDLAKLAVEYGEKEENYIIDAIGLETFSYKGLVKRILEILEIQKPVIHIPPLLGYWCGKLIGLFMKDVVITKEEIDGLMSDLLCTNSKPVGKEKLSDWIQENKDILGVKYASELGRRK